MGNHLPRRCGIATFTTDVTAAISAERADLDCFVVAMNDTGRHHDYPDRVRFEIAEADLASYRRAADFLNVNNVDVVSVQHEYGIFGGKAGAHVLTLLRALRMTIITTVHTVLAKPHLLQQQRIFSSADGRLVQALIAGEWRDLYTFTDEALPAVDFEVANWYTSTHPASRFRRNLIVSRATPTARYVLFNRELTTYRGGSKETTCIDDADELVGVLSSRFGLSFAPETRFGGPGAPWATQ